MSQVPCGVCPHHCKLNTDQTGICTARCGAESLNYGEITAIALDPIEKKPLNMFYPGRFILSVGSWGCNMKCPWCQNDRISRGPAHHIHMTPEELVSEAQIYTNNIGVAYTYNEPLIGFEFVRDTARLVHEAGMKNVLVSNGLADPVVFQEILPYMDALNIDLKTIDPDQYRKIGGDLDVILQNISAAQETAHLELTTLIVPGFNDSEEEMEELVQTIRRISPSIPLHVSRYFPGGEMRHVKRTPKKTMDRMIEIAEQYLDHVFPGNM